MRSFSSVLTTASYYCRSPSWVPITSLSCETMGTLTSGLTLQVFLPPSAIPLVQFRLKSYGADSCRPMRMLLTRLCRHRYYPLHALDLHTRHVPMGGATSQGSHRIPCCNGLAIIIHIQGMRFSGEIVPLVFTRARWSTLISSTIKLSECRCRNHPL